jgi:hypothetical protein
MLDMFWYIHFFFFVGVWVLVVVGFWRLGYGGIGYSLSLNVVDFVLTVVVGSISEI